MNPYSAVLIVIGGLAAVLGAFGWLARRIRDRGGGGSLMGPVDEIYHPSALRSPRRSCAECG